MASRSIRRHTMRRSLSDLPTDLLLITINKLIDIFDFVHFGAVCRQWRTTLWHYRHNMPPQLPLLLVASKNKRDIYFKFCLVNFSNGVHTKVLSECEYDIEDCYYAGHGWLFAGDDTGRYPFLINPFLSSDNSIELPSLFLLSTDNSVELPSSLGFGVMKVVLSDNPAMTSSYVVMVMGEYGSNIKFFKSGNKSWTNIEFSFYRTYDDGIYCKETGCFYFINCVGRSTCVDFTSNHPREKKSPFPQTAIGGEWLAESSSGELFAVERNYFSEESFLVNKLVGSEWMGLNTLGDNILFLGANSFMFPYTDSGVLKRHHIYCGECDMKEFNMEDRSNHSLLGKKFASCTERKQIWVQPTLNMSNFALAHNER